MKPDAVLEYVTLATGNLSYNEEPKFRFLALGRQLARKLAADLGLAPGTFDIRTNKAGIAVSGEVTLHAERLYVSLGQSFLGTSFMFRCCNGRKDYSGAVNRWAVWTDLYNDYDHLLAELRMAIEEGNAKALRDAYRAAA